jgi:hypothetical protein
MVLAGRGRFLYAIDAATIVPSQFVSFFGLKIVE